MAQNWYPISLDKQEFVKAETNCCESFGAVTSLLLRQESNCLVDLLKLPVEPTLSEPPVPIELFQWDPSKAFPAVTACQQSSTSTKPNLIALPTEIIQGICLQLDGLSHLRLCLASPRLWAAGARQLQRRAMRSMGPWAGTRIMCLGASTRPGDLPKGCLTQSEQAKVDDGLHDDEVEVEIDDTYPTRWIIGSKCLCDRVEYTFRPVDSDAHYFRWLKDAMGTSLDSLPSRERSAWEHLAGAPLFPINEPWYLRNLTARCYVRSDRLHAAFHQPETKYKFRHGFPGLGEVLLSRICWSTVEQDAQSERKECYNSYTWIFQRAGTAAFGQVIVLRSAPRRAMSLTRTVPGATPQRMPSQG